MSTKITFTADEKDVLKELMNIASGNATAVIADLLNSFATLAIPDFEIYTPPELKNYLKEKCSHYNLYAKQGFLGLFEGETLFFLMNLHFQVLVVVLLLKEKISLKKTCFWS